MDQPAAINPYVKLSRRFGRQRLAALATTRALNVLVYFWCVQEPDGTVMASYDQIMQATGIRSNGTITAALAHLDTCGLIARLGSDLETVVGCFQLLEDWARFKRHGTPRGVEPSPKNGALLKNLVVVDPDQDSIQQQPLVRPPKIGEPPTSPSPEIGAAQSVLDVALQEGFLQRQGGDGAPSPLAVRSVEELVERYGEEAVLEGMAISVRQNKRTMAYLIGVLRNRAPLRAFYEEAQNGDQRPDRPAPPPPSEGDLLWAEACADLRVQLPHETYDTWLRNARLLDHSDGLFTVGVGNAHAVEWLEAGRLKGVVVKALRQAAGESAEVRFVVDKGA